MLKEPTSSSPLEKLMLWCSTSRCPETFPGLEGAKLGVLTGRQSPLGQRQSKPGHCAMEEEKWPLGTDPGRLPPCPSPLTAAPERPPCAPAHHQSLPHTLVEPADPTCTDSSPATCPLPLLANVSSHEEHFTALCQCLAPFSNCLKILVWGGREKTREGNPRAKEGENIPGWRRGQGLPATSIQQSPTAEPVRQRGQSTEARKSQAQGGGCRLRQPPLLSRSRRHLPPPPQ